MDIKSALPALALLVIASTSSALPIHIIDNGDYTTDSRTGLDWLDVTKTRGLSWNNVNDATRPGASDSVVVNADGEHVDLAGWTFATGAQFDTLVENFGYIAVTTDCAGGVKHCDRNAGQPELIEEMISILGDTLHADAPDDFANGNGRVSGLIKDERPNFSTLVFGAVIDDTQGDGVDLDDWVRTHAFARDKRDRGLRVGAFLVRPSEVPIPAAGWLFISAIAGLVGRRKLART